MRRSNKIEILGEELIDENPDLAMEVLATSSRLAIPLGWHYVLDLIWILRELEGTEPRREAPPLTVLDVGAGMGLLQFMLAQRGYRVISADMDDRVARASLHACFEFRHFAGSHAVTHPYMDHRLGSPSTALGKRLRSLRRSLRRGTASLTRRRRRLQDPAPDGLPPRPVVHLYRCDVRRMSALDDGAVDAAFSVSALEHNDPETISAIQRELVRVTRPGGFCLHTTSATQKGSEFHAPSHSYLMDDAELAVAYGLEEFESNWQDYNRLEEALQRPGRLARWLSHAYFESGRNGMPWGIWSPEYLPVGVRVEL